MKLGKSDRGLTLLEVLIGVVILGTAMAPVALVLSGGLQGSEIREEAARSLLLAQGKMDELLALDFDDLTVKDVLSDWVAAPDSVYREVWISDDPGGTFDADFKSLSVTVGSTTLTTYKTNAFEP